MPEEKKATKRTPTKGVVSEPEPTDGTGKAPIKPERAERRPKKEAPLISAEDYARERGFSVTKRAVLEYKASRKGVSRLTRTQWDKLWNEKL